MPLFNSSEKQNQVLDFLDERFGDAIRSILGMTTNWDVEKQKELMDYEADINRENREYNSIEAQMERLRKAGLNPDLAFSGGVNESSNPLLSNVPQVSHGHSSVPGMISSLAQASLANSQVDKNQADADYTRSKTKGQDISNQFEAESYGNRMAMLGKQLGFKDAEIESMKAQAQNYFGQTELFMKQIALMDTEMGLNYQRLSTERYKTRSAAYQSDVDFTMAKYYDSFMSARVKSFLADAGLSEARARNIDLETRFLFSTFDTRKQLLNFQRITARNEAFFNTPFHRYYQSLNTLTKEQVRFLPYQMAGALFESGKYFEHDKDGNVVYDEQGMPKIKLKYAQYQMSMGIASDILGALESVTRSFQNVGFGISAFRSGAGGLTSGGDVAIGFGSKKAKRLQELERWLEDPRNQNSPKYADKFSEYWRIQNGH
ncbi:MAG: hypothetical protein IKG81_05245 [Bacteroidales bacterium]|nr:hypothetical protein [Bacteroidales bacterium]